jgi:hypothetical protein
LCLENIFILKQKKHEKRKKGKKEKRKKGKNFGVREARTLDLRITQKL